MNEDKILFINKIKCLSKDNQLKIFNKCKELNVPFTKTQKSIHISFSDLPNDMVEYIKNIENRVYRTNNGNIIKSATFSKHDNVSYLGNEVRLKESIELVDEKVQVKNTFTTHQTRIKKILKEHMKKITSHKKVHIENSDEKNQDNKEEEDLDEQDVGEEEDLDEQDGGQEEQEEYKNEYDSNDDDRGEGLDDDDDDDEVDEVDEENVEVEVEEKEDYDDIGSIFELESILDCENDVILNYSNYTIEERLKYYKSLLTLQKIDFGQD